MKSNIRGSNEFSREFVEVAVAVPIGGGRVCMRLTATQLLDASSIRRRSPLSLFLSFLQYPDTIDRKKFNYNTCP
jgi:hypothetical protein